MSLTSEDKEWLRAEFVALESRIIERISAFDLPKEMRRKADLLAIRAMDLEIGNMKDRLDKLDPRIPPQ